MDPVNDNRGVGAGLDLYYITDSKKRVGLKPGIIAKTHSEENARMLIRALNLACAEGLLEECGWDSHIQVESNDD